MGSGDPVTQILPHCCPTSHPVCPTWQIQTVLFITLTRGPVHEDSCMGCRRRSPLSPTCTLCHVPRPLLLPRPRCEPTRLRWPGFQGASVCKQPQSEKLQALPPASVHCPNLRSPALAHATPTPAPWCLCARASLVELSWPPQPCLLSRALLP